MDSGGGFAVVQDWSPTATWTLSGATPPGSYQVQAEVWLGLTPTPPDAVSAAISFVINVIPASGVTLTSDLPSPQVPGTAITFTAAGTGSTSPYSYRFWLFDGSAWNMVQDWSLVAIWTLPDTTVAGSYRVIAQVRTSSALRWTPHRWL
ncbi:MAG: hypothetical protein IPO09_18565 [Anaeromyxobacter sp.]|nr:hypothetical protein [Anaeromyxobacter sp.]